ncbi:uncharacterized protein [Amphiura filiformis]
MRGFVIAFMVLFSAVIVNSRWAGETWTCLDFDSDVCSRNEGECDSKYTEYICPATCGRCACENRAFYCDDNEDVCAWDEVFKQDCPVTCGICPCMNNENWCDDEAKLGCDINKAINKACPLLCGDCTPERRSEETFLSLLKRIVENM